MSLFKPYRWYADKEEIEREAEAILRQMQATPKYVPKFPLDPSRVAEFLGLDVVWNHSCVVQSGSLEALNGKLNILLGVY